MEDNMTQDQNQVQEVNEPVVKPDEAKIRAALADGGAIDTALEDTPAEPAEETTPVDGGDFEGADTDDIPKPATEAKPTTQKQETPPAQNVYDHVWQDIQKIYEEQFGPNTFKKPENIEPGKEFDALLAFLHQNLEPNLDGIPDDAKEIIELHRQGAYNPDEYFKQKSSQLDILQLPAYDFLFNMYRSTQGKSEKNPDGHTEEEIHEFLKSMNKIQLKELADQKKASIMAHREQIRAQRELEQKQLADAQFQNIQRQKEEQAKKIVNQFGQSVDFFGIEPSPEDRAAYNRDFVEMVKLNPETGTSKLYDMLQDDGTLYKIGYYIWKGENLRGYLTEMKESVKKNIENKLDPTLEKEKGSTKLRKAVDRGKLF